MERDFKCFAHPLWTVGRGWEEGFDGHSSVLGIILWEVRKVSTKFDFAHGWLKKEEQGKLFQTSNKG